MELSLQNIKIFIFKYLPLIFLGLGVFFIYLSEAFCFTPVYWNNIFDKVGVAIFSSGVFAAVLKSIQFTGIFREELEKIILGTDFIKKRNDLPDLWKKVSNAVYRSKFPEISSELDDIVLKTYLPTEKQYYYKDFVVTLHIEELTKTHIIKFTQTTKFCVIPATGEKTVKIVNGVGMDKVDNSQKIEVEYFKVDGVPVEPIVKTDDTGSEVEYRFTVELTGKEKYFVEKKERREYSIKEDNYKLFRVNTFTKGMEVSIKHPDNLRVSFFNIGLVNHFSQNHVEFKNCVNRNHKEGVILPHQGWGVTFSRK
ncbi:hypothetical protein [Pontibacter liquoris]|uniref:hypothetical protein n=1 Tax=Pontibacter liquoris TaxID=2905677 RepID=UPI001FA7E53B|nr:hypothetical protein [Pontibacter liquoris]